ncbi:MAG: hypothetical protein GX995_07595 [Clostridiales bacterium]|nr:hypothetical protein [Clostridiales bacterium]
MFGYITVNKDELKIKEFDLYNSYYCGLCRKLKARYGNIGLASLSYDMTFLLVLLTGLYEPKTGIKGFKCIAHPFEKKPARINKITSYVADMSIVLSYYKCRDDWDDDKEYTKLAYFKLLEKKYKDIKEKYLQKVNRIDELLKELSDKEKANEENIDIMAGMFGKVMAEVFAYQDDVWNKSLQKIGFYLGKFVYIMDAYEDIEDDIKKGNYNPFLNDYNEADFEEQTLSLLTMMMAECSREFEILPIIANAEILRNILYSGVWNRYEIIRNKRQEKQVQTDDRSI